MVGTWIDPYPGIADAEVVSICNLPTPIHILAGNLNERRTVHLEELIDAAKYCADERHHDLNDGNPDVFAKAMRSFIL